MGAAPQAGCCATSISATAARCRSRRGISIARCSIKLGKRGYDFVAGLEVEFHLFKLEDAHMAPEDAGQPGRPPSVSLLSHGYQYLTEQRYDQMEPALEIIRRDVLALGLPLAVGRGRVRPEPVRIHLPADRKVSRPPTTWCCFAAP